MFVGLSPDDQKIIKDLFIVIQNKVSEMSRVQVVDHAPLSGLNLPVVFGIFAVALVLVGVIFYCLKGINRKKVIDLENNTEN